ncbi:nuclear pore complex protein Nup214 isoform X2 [Euwallacea fornicatus]|uniref:nuclear pore complex protein Nup214 isoform X2 n=1 Tax=Euwallacea fornicatus TaxID=995702 RepID=UPI00338E3673
MANSCPDPVEVGDLQFKLQCQLKVFNNQDVSALPISCSFLTCASRYGLLFVGLNSPEFQVIQTKTIFNYGPKDKDVTSYPRRPIQLPSSPKHLSVNCDSTILAVVVEKDQCPTVIFFDVLSFLSQSFKVINELRLSATPNIHVKEVNWNPSLPNIFTACKSDCTLGVYELKGNSFDINELPAVAGATCFCWSPKGKQIAVGSKDGKITQYKPDLKAVKVINGPKLENPSTIISLQWISNFQFIGVYQIVQDGSCCIVVVDAPKTGEPVFTNYDDICYSSLSRPSQFFMALNHSWNILMVASANSTEVGVLGCNGETWIQWVLTDTARAELPLSADHQETFPVGLTFDISPTSQLPWGDHYIPPCPLLCLLSHQGVLCVFNVVYLKSGVPSVCTPPDPITDNSGLSLFTSSITSLTPLKPAATVSVPPSIMQSTPIVSKGNEALSKSLFGGQTTVTPIKPQQQTTTGSSLFGPMSKATPTPQTQTSEFNEKYSSIFAALNPNSTVTPVKPVVVSVAPKPETPIAAPQNQVVSKVEPIPPPIKPQTNATKQTVNRTAEETLALMNQLIVDEQAALNAEITELIRLGRGVKLNVGSDQEMIEAVKQIQALQEFVADAVDNSQGHSSEVHSLKQNLVQSWAWFEEAKSHYNASKNEVVNLLIKIQSLDSLSEKRRRDIEQLAYYIQSQIACAHKSLDEQWDNFQDYAKERHRFKMPTMETIFQTMVKQNAVLQKQEYNLKGIAVQMKPKTKSKISSLLLSLDKDKGLTEEFQSLRLDPQDIMQLQVEKIKNQAKKLSGDKITKLQRLIKERPVTRVEAVRPQVSSWTINQSLKESLKKLSVSSSKLSAESGSGPKNQSPEVVSFNFKGGINSSQTSAFASLAPLPKTPSTGLLPSLGQIPTQEAPKTPESSFFNSLKPVPQKVPVTTTSSFASIPFTSLAGDPISNAATAINTNIAGKCLKLTDSEVDADKSTNVITVSLFGDKEAASNHPLVVSSAGTFKSLFPAASQATAAATTNIFASSNASPFLSAATTTTTAMTSFFGGVSKTSLAAGASSATTAPSTAKATFGSCTVSLLPSANEFGAKTELNSSLSTPKSMFAVNNAAGSTESAAAEVKSPSTVSESQSFFGTNKLLFGSASASVTPKTQGPSNTSDTPHSFGSKPSIFGLPGATTTTASNSIFGQVPATTIQELFTVPKTTIATTAGDVSASTVSSQSIFGGSGTSTTQKFVDDSTETKEKKAPQSPFGVVSKPGPLFIGSSSPSAHAEVEKTVFGSQATAGTEPLMTVPTSKSAGATFKIASAPNSVDTSTSSTNTNVIPTDQLLFEIAANPKVSTATEVSTSSSETKIFAPKVESSHSPFSSNESSLFSSAAAATTSEATPIGSTASIFATSKGDSKKVEFSTPVITSGNIFTPQSSTSTAPLFGTPASTASSFGASVFGAAQVSSSPFGATSSVFGAAANTSSNAFGGSASAKPVFASPVNTGFGPPATTASSFGQPSSFGTASAFGETASGNAAVPAAFGQAASFGGNIFGAATSTTSGSTASVFGSSAATSPFGAGFAAATTTVSNSVFGSPVATTVQQPSGAFGFGALTVGGGSSSSGSIFGGGSTSAGSFGQPSANPFGKVEIKPSSFASSSTNIFGSPASAATTSASTNIFASPVSGSSAFSSSSFPSSNSPFGASSTFAQKPSAFGQAPAFGQSAFGSPQSGPFSSGGNSPVAQSGFGAQASFQKIAGFGSAPVFGGPAFGSAPTFGGTPAFGGTSVFGSPDKVFGSTTPAEPSGGFGANNAQPIAGFGNLASQNTVGFGNLAQQTNNMNSMPFSGGSSFTSWR